MPSGKTLAVNCRSFWTPSVTRRSDLPSRCSRRRAIRRRVMGVPPGPGLVPGHRVVVGPGDPVPGQHVEDGPGGRVVEQVERQVIDEAVRRSRDEEAAVGERRAQARAEPVIGQRERPGQAVVERQVVFGPVAHADGSAIGVGQHRPGCWPRTPGSFPCRHCRWLACQLCEGARGCWTVEGRWCARTGSPSVPGLDTAGSPSASEREALAAAAQHAEVVVVGVVLHHQHDDVLDLRQQVGAGGQGRLRGAARAAAVHAGAPGISAHIRSSRSHTIAPPSPLATSRYRLTRRSGAAPVSPPATGAAGGPIARRPAGAA